MQGLTDVTYPANREIWLMLFIMLMCMAICAVSAWLMARKLPRSVNVVLAGLSTAGMLLFGRFLTDSVWITGVVPARWLPVFGNWLPMLAGLLVGFGWVISPSGRRTKSILFGTLMVLALVLSYRRLFEARPAVISQWRNGVCLQSTNATCGAAAAATLLSTVGVSSSEEEMVNLCFSTWKGTSIHGIVRGLAVKLEGTKWRVRAREMTVGELAELEASAILEVGLRNGIPKDLRYVTRWGWIPGVEHTAVMFGILPDGNLDIGDPTAGREIWRPEAVEVLWQGTAITLEKRP